MSKKVKKIVLAYSGGLDTSVIIQWLRETYGCPVVAFVADVGQGEDLEAIREKALRTGAAECHVEDLREEFVRDYVFPILRAGAVYEGGYLLGTAIARPLIAKAQMEVARRVGADAVAHGATGKGNDQVRFELTYLSIDPKIRIIAPWREWAFKGREDLVAYAETHGIPVPVTKAKPYSIDRNLLHISFEGGILEDPWAEAPEEMYVLSVSPEKAPDTPEYAEVEFEEGDPVAVNGEADTPARLLARLNEMGGAHGVGRVDLVENRFVGIKSRGVYETPGGTILHTARSALESIVLDREALHLRAQWMPKYAEQVYYGFWFSPEREMIQAAVDAAA
ncbi:MAG: argininosuccinate synthase, partial [Nitrospinota bacterium]